MRISGAGVICYTHQPGGSLAVLLGREKETPGWRQGSNKWSGFSGKVDPAECAPQGAAREFVEESLATVPLTENGFVPVKVQDIARLLEYDNESGLLEVTKHEDDCRYLVYIRHVAYKDYASSFRQTRQGLLVLDSIFKTFQTCRKGHLPRCFLPGARISCALVVIDIDFVCDTIILTLWDEVSNLKRTLEVGVPSTLRRRVTDLVSSWKEVLRIVTDSSNPLLKHPAVTVHRLHGHVVGAMVKKSYLEKSEVRWWSLRDLEQISLCRGSRSEVFRHYFLDTIPLLADAIRNHENSLEQEKRPSLFSDPSSKTE